MHTSGRPLNPHPHLHVLLAEATIDKDCKLKPLYFLPFDRLRRSMMFIFLQKASKILKSKGDAKLYREFNIQRSLIIKQYKDGFYSYGPKTQNGDDSSENNRFYTSKKVADYIAPYASHPPIAESNILSLDEDKNEVT